MDFQQSQTYKNLLTAYDLEAVVSTRYSIYADTARQDGFIEIGNVFDITSRNEKEHARIWLRQINRGTLPSTADNLNASAQYESQSANIYREYAKVATQEGYNEIAALFNGVANIELNHNLRFQSNYNDVVRGEVLCKPEAELWICMQCGNIMSGTCAPAICPVCGFPQGYYRLYISAID